jgi:hypothetical protein
MDEFMDTCESRIKDQLEKLPAMSLLLKRIGIA